MTFCDDRSKKRLRRHSQNVTVSTQSLSETSVNKPSPPFLAEELIVKNPQLVSFFVDDGKCQYVSYPLKPLLENPSTPVKPSIFTMRNNRTSMIGSCNGLLCLYDSSRSNYVRLWNPSIKLRSKKSPTIFGFNRMRLLYCGFGYDQVNDRYKVLAVLRNEDNLDETKTKIHTFGEKSWTTVQNFPCDPRRDPGDLWLGKFVSGTLNWIVNKDMIVSFDLEKETYGEMLFPQHQCDSVNDPVLYVLSNCICVSFYHSKETHWVVWMMKEYGVVESWTKLMVVSEDKFTSNVRNSRLFISEYGVLFLRPKLSELIVYNLNNDGGLDYRTTIFGKFGHYLHIYNESLVSPQRPKHIQKKNKRKRKQRLRSQSPKLVL